MKLRIGCSSWTSEAWWGRVYPTGLKDGDRLVRYSELFDTVEVDSTYYRPPSTFLVDRWSAVTPPGFRFALKFPRDLLDPKRPVEPVAVGQFLETVRRLGPKLGPVLLQFPPWVKPGRATEFLGELLDALDPALRYAVELRDAGWFSGAVGRDVLSDLRARRIALAWSYLTYVEVPPELTTDLVYLRFIGDHHTVPEAEHGAIRLDRSPELRRWARRLQSVEDAIHEAFVFFNNHFAGFAPESANQFRELVGLPRVPIEAPRPPPLPGRQSELDVE